MRNRGWNQKRILAIYLVLLASSTFCPSVAAARISREVQADDPPASTAAPGPVSDYAACARCHKDTVRNFINNPHASQSAGSHTSSMPCADCHGSGEAHVQSGGDKSKIFTPTGSSAQQVNDTCLKCHAGKHVLFERSAHGRSGVTCVRCHSVHSAHESKHLLTVSQPELCFQCHEEEKPQFSAPFRHKVMEGVILCTDCHEPHGSFGEQLQRSPAEEDFICTKCHAETAGPFKYEHAIVKTEGCSACHLPHGGPNSHMLNRASVDTICLLCHFPPQISSSGESLVTAHSPTKRVQLCTDCHADIHGSNESTFFLKPK